MDRPKLNVPQRLAVILGRQARRSAAIADQLRRAVDNAGATDPNTARGDAEDAWAAIVHSTSGVGALEAACEVLDNMTAMPKPMATWTPKAGDIVGPVQEGTYSDLPIPWRVERIAGTHLAVVMCANGTTAAVNIKHLKLVSKTE